MQRIKKILDTNLKNYKIEKQVKERQVLGAWEKIISDYFPEAAGKTMAMHVRNGVLTIASLNREIARIIAVCQEQLAKALNSLVGKPLVFKIYCLV